MVKQQNNNIGAPHFYSVMKQQRNNNYNLIKVLCEFIDNIIKKCENINIITTLNENKLYPKIKTMACNGELRTKEEFNEILL